MSSSHKDQDDSQEDEDAAAMAAAMGFSTFGSKPRPKKKQKVTHPSKSGEDVVKSGGNKIVLGERKPPTTSIPKKSEDGTNPQHPSVQETTEPILQPPQETIPENDPLGRLGDEGGGKRGERGERRDGFEGHTWQQWKSGIRNQHGDLAIFDWSFVEDPWAGLLSKG
ncbi:MAG: hypothetical protein Q9174_004115 [Haloplaca sp. 1 TL-2023]